MFVQWQNCPNFAETSCLWQIPLLKLKADWESALPQFHLKSSGKTFSGLLSWNQINCELHVFAMDFFFSPVKSKPLKTSFHLFGETTSGSLNAPSVGEEGNLSPSTVSCRWGLDFTAWATWRRADVLGVMKVQTAQKWKQHLTAGSLSAGGRWFSPNTS